MAIKILLADDHPLFRKGLRDLLQGQADFEIVAEAENGREAVDKARAHSPDIVVMDIAMPDLSGIEATREILRETPSTRVVALSMHAGKRFVEEMLGAGAAGYILKKSVPEDIVNGIQAVSAGETFLSPAITGVVVSQFKDLLSGAAQTDDLQGMPSILRTKLHRPVLPPDIVPREKLISRWEEMRKRPVTLISAPAGYGKSTLACLMTEACDCPHSWLSVDEEENDLHTFLTHIVAAIEESFPGACDVTRSLMQGAEPAPASDLGRHLVNDLFNIKSPFILVLDDFHKIREEAVHELMSVLMNHPPQNLHLILLTRRDLPLLTSTLRGRGQINEIGVADLYFSVDETAFFLKHALGRSIDAKHLETIQEALEGWPAGIRLMVQSLNYSGDLDFLLAGLDGGFATIVDYLWNEVLLHQSPEMAKLMSATASLECFCAPLCDVLIEADPVLGAAGINGDEFIARLQKGNLFLVPLDTGDQWFRYHHLFQNLLQRRLNKWWRPEEVATLHSQAKSWLAANTTTSALGDACQASFRGQTDNNGSDAAGVSATPHNAPRASSIIPSPMAEPLTNRELDVLDLLAQRLSNKEIADKLCISTTTVKGHLQNIYGKLSVNKRRDAIDRAKKLGIL
jgi:ATP/maltotriose-dependent transcriptional regulator MalT/ActR/RegA family two-component response regulator